MDLEKYKLLNKLDDIKKSYPDIFIPNVDFTNTELEIRSAYEIADKLVKEKEKFEQFKNLGFVILYHLKNIREINKESTDKVNKLLFELTQVTKIQEIQELIKNNIRFNDINQISVEDIVILFYATIMSIKL